MKNILKGMIRGTAKNPWAWLVYRACGRIAQALNGVYKYADLVRAQVEVDETLAAAAAELFPAMTVMHGPLQGLKYPEARSVGSALLPKLLGSYESELHPVLERLLCNDYGAIVDIGCAEGYYAVGLGLRYPRAQIYAFDTDPTARNACVRMARLNALGDRFHVAGFCSDDTLCSIPLGGKSLVISDCEGYEAHLFTAKTVEHLAGHDLIIEVHDFIDIDTSTRLRQLFAETHLIQSVRSIDDIEKAHTYRFVELEKHSLKERLQILSERRPTIMEWLVMTPKNPPSEAT